MAKRIKDHGSGIVNRNIVLLDALMRYLIAEPRIFSALPDNFELVILPEDDPEIRLYNLDLLDRLGAEGKPVVLARLKSVRHLDLKRVKPDLYVPIAA